MIEKKSKNLFLKAKNFDERLRIARQESIDWAHDVLEKSNRYVILDTETTGLEKNDEVISISIININADTLVNTLVKPTRGKGISRGAYKVHGISKEILNDAPTFDKVWPEIVKVITNKTVISYNAEFDIRMLEQTMEKYKLKENNVGNEISVECAMTQYSHYVGEWWESKQDFRWQSLPTATHASLDDCIAVLNLIKMMASSINSYISEINPMNAVEQYAIAQHIEAQTIINGIFRYIIKTFYNGISQDWKYTASIFYLLQKYVKKYTNRKLTVLLKTFYFNRSAVKSTRCEIRIRSEPNC